jgi:hypothetical protein
MKTTPASGYTFITGNLANGTPGAPTKSLNGDGLLYVTGAGYGDTGWAADGAEIIFHATEDFSDTATGTELQFLTIPNGTIASRVAWTIGQDGLLASADLTDTNKAIGASGNRSGLFSGWKRQGAGTVDDQFLGVYGVVSDAATVYRGTITGATNASPIAVTVASHGFSTGDVVAVSGVAGNTAANGVWTVTKTGANTFTLNGSIGNGAYSGSGAIATSAGVLVAGAFTVVPTVARGGLTPSVASDDMAAVSAFNGGTMKATDAFYLGRNSGIAGSEWTTVFTSDANADFGIRLNGTIVNYGLDFNSGTFGLGAIRLGNNSPVVGRNAAGNADVEIFRVSALDRVVFSNTAGAVLVNFNGPVLSSWSLQWSDGVHLTLGTSTGSEIGTAANQKLGFWGVTPVVRPTGWTVATGTPQRTTFATSTVTLAQLAGVVMALEQDLIAAGLIGA